MVSKFKCRFSENGYCKRWLRECVSWEHCELADYGAPCPRCTASSPLEHEQCKECNYQNWKKENYIE